MVHSLEESHRRLVSGRGAQNGLRHALIGASLLIFLTPFVLVTSYIITAGLYEIGKVASQIIVSLTRTEQRHHKADAWTDSQFKEGPDGAASSQTSDRTDILRILPATAFLLSVGMVILLWGMSSVTTLNLLARMGARPPRAGGTGSEAARTLGMLSAAAGIDRPKTYIVQSSFPTAFSASTDERHNVVAVTTGALDLLDAREMEALLAHEISHLVNRDSQLDSILAALAAITEYPFRTFQQTLSDPNAKGLMRPIAVLEMVLSPFGLYLFLVSPILNALIRALVLRSRDFNADANAAQLTGDPESLVYALAKIGGVVTVVGKTTVSSLPSHTSLSPRIERLMRSYGGFEYTGLEQAIARGKQYARERPGMGQDQPALTGNQDPLSMINQDQLTGRVYQLMSNEAIPLFDRVGRGAPVRTWVQPGALLVVFETPGRMRQVNTADETFGYMRREVKLKAVDGVLPQEVYEPSAREAVEELLRGERGSAQKQGWAPVPLLGGLTGQQLCVALGFSVAVFASTTGLLFMFVGH